MPAKPAKIYEISACRTPEAPAQKLGMGKALVVSSGLEFEMKHEFQIIYTPIEDGWYMASAPELPGAVTQGQTMAEARAMIKEAIELLLESYRENARRDAPGNAIWETMAIDLPAA